MNDHMDFIHVWYVGFIHNRLVGSEYEHSSPQNRGPSDGPPETKLWFSQKRL
jgi:hypothetical protein